MSGFFGILNFDGCPVHAEILDRAAQSLVSHQCDGKRTHTDKTFGIVFCAFHTTREAHSEIQPFISASGAVITCDGRLDNRSELMDDLQHRTPVDTPDVTLFSMAFAKWGDRCLPRFVGDWALSIWSPADKTLLLARDYMGIRHLFYLVQERTVMWSSSLATLVRLSERTLTINEDYVAAYLASSTPAHLTAYREIQAVPPGAFVKIRNGQAITSRYWSFQPGRRIRYRSDHEYEEQFRHLLRQAVRRRLRSDSPIVGELSGGIDSSSIICMADDIIEKGDVDSVRLDTISTFDPKEPDGDERPYMAQIEAKRGRCGHHLNREDYGHVLDLNFSRFIPAPGASECSGKLRDDLLQLFRNQRYRVLLSGIGGDELLGGVPNPLAQLADLIVMPRPFQLVKQLTAWSLLKRRPCIHLLGETLLTLLPATFRVRFSRQARVAPWINPVFAHRCGLSIRQLGPVGGHGFWQPSRREYAQTVIALSRQMSRLPAHGIAGEERRYPYLDRSLVEFLISIPATQLLRPGERRSLMRRSLAGIVPQEVLWRKTKAFVNRSVLLAFENCWTELELLFESPLSGVMGYVDAVRLREGLRSAKNGDASQMMYLITTLSLELWLRSITHHHVIEACGTACPSSTQSPLPVATQLRSNLGFCRQKSILKERR